MKIYNKAYYEAHKTEAIVYYESHKGKIKVRNEARKEERKAWQKTYNEIHKESISAYVKNRMSVDPLFKLSCRLRIRLSNALQRKVWNKNSHFNEYIGCTLEELKAHIEKQFTPNMGWNNYGAWEIDHIVPLASAAAVEEMIKLCHYTNLQPLWMKANRSKGAGTDV